MSHFKPEYCCHIYPGMPQPKPFPEEETEASLLESRIAGLTPDQLKAVAVLSRKKISQIKSQKKQG